MTLLNNFFPIHGKTWEGSVLPFLCLFIHIHSLLQPTADQASVHLEEGSSQAWKDDLALG